MWPFKTEKKSSGEKSELQGSLFEQFLSLKAQVKAIELQLDEQHDFIRRLASRRAKEKAYAEDLAGPRVPAAEPDEPGTAGTGLSDRKSALWSKVRTLKRPA